MSIFRKVVIAIVGGLLLIIGVAMIILPGPAFIMIPAGLAVLAVEFVWARRWLASVKQWIKGWTHKKVKSSD
jgi:tellurite resistance protein TerC